MLEGVLDILSGLFQISLDLVSLTFGLEFVVAGGFTRTFFDLAFRIFCSITNLVPSTHLSLLLLRGIHSEWDCPAILRFS